MTFRPASGLSTIRVPPPLYLTQLRFSMWGAGSRRSPSPGSCSSSPARPLKLGLISTLQFAPVLLFSIVAGAAADRLHKRRVLIASQTTYLCRPVVLAVLVWTGAVQYWHVCAFALVSLRQRGRPAGAPLFVVELVGREDLGNAVALNSASFNAARIVGPAVAASSSRASAWRPPSA